MNKRNLFSTHSLATRFVVFAFAALFHSGPAYSQVTVSNLGEAYSASGSTTFSSWRANSFTTDTSAYTLNSLTLRFSDSEDLYGGFFVGIYSDSASAPGSLVLLLDGTINPNNGDITYTPATTLGLSASTTYWVVLGVSPNTGSLFEDSQTASDNQSNTGGASWLIGDNSLYSSDQGATWAFLTADSKMFSITATAVPEPGAYAVFAALTALGFVAWRRRI